ncbi:unnamed protein product [Leptidea sinapis]|uniref:Fatty acyl-CoA reductase n=1 Tax=Leptidea sinapis TaxID=189913 RepID=A0A5E4QJQ5_9NEOP|nr:unnamed protein product [Leptidea sinapis]
MTFLEDRDFRDVPAIKEYYKGKTIFITGGTGFMGKVLIEKLLYSCTELDRIYLLLRKKKGVNPDERLKVLYESLCFTRLKKERPGVFESKVFFIGGDVSEIGLGISEEDRSLLINRVNIVFHVAASVRFDDKLDSSAKMNLRGTREMVQMAEEMSNLESFVHVSTGYANTNRETIEEVVYPPLADWRDTLLVCETTDTNVLAALTNKYIGDMPNTYVFTKQLAEHVVYEKKGKLPATIIRPTIVSPSWREPFEGWIENFNGPVGLLTAMGLGVLRTAYSSNNMQDYVPVDTAIRMFIVVGWVRGTKKLEATDDIPVYNCCSGSLQNISLEYLRKMSMDIIEKYPFDKSLWVVRGFYTDSEFIYNLSVFFEHLLPALALDGVLKLLRKKPITPRPKRI